MDLDIADDTSDRSRFKFVGVGIPLEREERLKWVRATFVAVDESRVTLTLSDGRSLALPLDWSARLPHGTPAERNTWRLLKDGIAVHWPLLGEIVSVKEALAGRRPEEDAETIKQWIKDRPKPDSAAEMPAMKRKAG